jgi:hypothetical protein
MEGGWSHSCQPPCQKTLPHGVLQSPIDYGTKDATMRPADHRTTVEPFSGSGSQGSSPCPAALKPRLGGVSFPRPKADT